MKNDYPGQTELLDTVDAQIWQLIDPETYGVVNQAHAGFFGKSKEDFEFKKITEALPAKTAKALFEDNLSVFSRSTSTCSIKVIKNCQGEERHIAITKTPRVDENKKVKFVICTGIDFTGYKNLQGDLHPTNSAHEPVLFFSDIKWKAIAEKRLIQTEKLKGALEMAGAVCHELKQPLQAVLGHSELLMMDSPDENPMYERLNTIVTQAIRLAELIDKLHKITKYEASDLIKAK